MDQRESLFMKNPTRARAAGRVICRVEMSPRPNTAPASIPNSRVLGGLTTACAVATEALVVNRPTRLKMTKNGRRGIRSSSASDEREAMPTVAHRRACAAACSRQEARPRVITWPETSSTTLGQLAHGGDMLRCLTRVVGYVAIRRARHHIRTVFRLSVCWTWRRCCGIVDEPDHIPSGHRRRM